MMKRFADLTTQEQAAAKRLFYDATLSLAVSGACIPHELQEVRDAATYKWRDSKYPSLHAYVEGEAGDAITKIASVKAHEAYYPEDGEHVMRLKWVRR